MAGIPLTPLGRVTAAQRLVTAAASRLQEPGPGAKGDVAGASNLVSDALYELNAIPFPTRKAPVGFNPPATLSPRATIFTRAAISEATKGLNALTSLSTGFDVSGDTSPTNARKFVETTFADAASALSRTGTLLDQVARVEQQAISAERRSNARHDVVETPGTRHGWTPLPPARSLPPDWLGPDPRKQARDAVAS